MSGEDGIESSPSAPSAPSVVAAAAAASSEGRAAGAAAGGGGGAAAADAQERALAGGPQAGVGDFAASADRLGKSDAPNDGAGDGLDGGGVVVVEAARGAGVGPFFLGLVFFLRAASALAVPWPLAAGIAAEGPAGGGEGVANDLRARQ